MIAAQICMKHGKACFRCEECIEDLAETRKRFRKEYDGWAREMDELESDHSLIWRGNYANVLGKWHAFAVGAGHKHDAKFRERGD